MKRTDFLIYRFAKWILMLAGGASLVVALLLFLTMLFNFRPYIVTQNGSSLGLPQFNKGIPVRAAIEPAIWNNGLYFDKYSLETEDRFLEEERGPKITQAQPVALKFAGNASGEQVNGAAIYDLVYFVKPGSLEQRFLFLLPELLKFLLLAWCAFLLARLIGSVMKGNSFIEENHNRLTKIGLGIIAVELFFLVWGFLVGSLADGVVNYNNNSPVNFEFKIKSHFDLEWLVAGCIIMILSKAFLSGNILQKDQEYTI